MQPEHSGSEQGTGLADLTPAGSREAGATAPDPAPHTPPAPPRASGGTRGYRLHGCGADRATVLAKTGAQPGQKGQRSAPGVICILLRSGGAGVKLDSPGGVGGTQLRGRWLGPWPPSGLGLEGTHSPLSSPPRPSSPLGSEPGLTLCDARRREGGLQELWGPGHLPRSLDPTPGASLTRDGRTQTAAHLSSITAGQAAQASGLRSWGGREFHREARPGAEGFAEGKGQQASGEALRQFLGTA